MPHPEKCVIKKGYFPETANGLQESFAFVSLDCDLYQPMLAGLNFFYPKISTGGYIMIHDYNLDEFAVKKAVADYEMLIGEKLRKVPLPDSNGTIVIAK